MVRCEHQAFAIEAVAEQAVGKRLAVANVGQWTNMGTACAIIVLNLPRACVLLWFTVGVHRADRRALDIRPGVVHGSQSTRSTVKPQQELLDHVHAPERWNNTHGGAGYAVCELHHALAV